MSGPFPRKPSSEAGRSPKLNESKQQLGATRSVGAGEVEGLELGIMEDDWTLVKVDIGTVYFQERYDVVTCGIFGKKGAIKPKRATRDEYGSPIRRRVRDFVKLVRVL